MIWKLLLLHVLFFHMNNADHLLTSIWEVVKEYWSVEETLRLQDIQDPLSHVGYILGAREDEPGRDVIWSEPDISSHFANFNVVYYDFAGQARTEISWTTRSENEKVKLNIWLWIWLILGLFPNFLIVSHDSFQKNWFLIDKKNQILSFYLKIA